MATKEKKPSFEEQLNAKLDKLFEEFDELKEKTLIKLPPSDKQKSNDVDGSLEKQYKLRGNRKKTIILSDDDLVDIDGLEAAVHRIITEDNVNDLEYYLPHFEKMPKVYGNKIHERTKLVIDSYIKSAFPTGALIVGTKGNGKSALVENICNVLIEKHNVPVIYVKEMIKAPVLEKIIRAVGDCVVLFDEYSKYYSPRFGNTTGGNADADHTDELLTLFSDKTLGKVLWLIADNKMQNISEFLHNRTGRMLYRFIYDFVEEDVVVDICKEFKISSELTEFLKDHAKNSRESVDNILTLAKEAKRHGHKTVDQFQPVFESLNVRPPMFRYYYIKTDEPDKLSATIADGKVTLTVKCEKDVLDEDGGIVAKKGQNVARYSVGTLTQYRNRKGTVFGVNYSFAWKNKDKKPEAEYELEVNAVPSSEFKSSFFF